MTPLEDTGTDPASRLDVQEAIRRALKELQTLKVAVVNGAAADTNIALAGADTNDLIVAVLQFNITADTGTDATGNKVDNVVDLTAEAAITSAGNMQLADTATTGDKLIVLYFSGVAGA